jgi:CRISPR/Cas system type I-B associated protein Csh2 (Cas7 group RAMP superfamily)
MLAVIDMIKTKYGSAEGYLTQNTSLTTEDIEKIRSSLIVPA